jgi:putative ABC transport system permease protein
MNRQRMFLRMMLRSALGDRSRTTMALLAVIVVAGMATALLNLYADLDNKLHKEFRSYGANVVVTSTDGLPPDAIERIAPALPAGSNAAPFLYAVARTSDGSPVVVVATDFNKARKLDSWWSVSAWPKAPNDALVGARAQHQLSPNNAPFDITYGGKTFRVQPAGTLRTGGDEDSRVYLSLTDFEDWTGLLPNAIEIAVPGGTNEIEATMTKLRQELPGAKVEPVRQLVEAEANVLGKTRGALLGTSIVVIVLATMCLLATLTASVLNRRKDFAVMRALGATRAMIRALFLAETAAFALVGCLAGILLGIGLAIWIGHANFHAAVSPRWSVLPVVVIGTVLVAAAAAVVPMLMLEKAQPATLLRGE